MPERMPPKVIARRLRVAATLTMMRNEGWAEVFEAGADALEQLQASRDRQADLEVYAADLHELLQQVYDMPADDGFGKAIWLAQPFAAKVRAALAVDPPERGRQLRDQVERLTYELRLWEAAAGMTTEQATASGHLPAAALDQPAPQDKEANR